MRIDGNIIIRGLLLKGRPNDAVRKQQNAAMHEATQYVALRVKERTPQGVFGAQGGLLGSIQPEVRNTKTRVIGIVATASIYSLVVEKGRRPGKGVPPKGTMVRWIEVKMGVPRDEAMRIEYPVRMKIAKKGTEGAHMFEETLEKDWPDIQAIFDRHGVTISRELSR